MSKQPVIALVHASIGSGHKTAACAIQEAFSELYPQVETHLIDVLDYGTKRFDGNSLTHSFAGPTAPFYDMVWDNDFIGRLTWGSTGWLTRRFYSDFTEKLREISPDAVICTHALGANIAVGSQLKLFAEQVQDEIQGGIQETLKESELAQAVIDALPSEIDLSHFEPKRPEREFYTIAIPTDYGVNASWPYAYLDMFCVGGPEIREALTSRKVKPENISVTGIPVHKTFGTPRDKAELRRELGLPVDGKIALALAGASMPGPYVKFKKYLSHALPSLCAHEDTSIIVVTGKDSEYEAELRNLATQPGYENLHVYGYVKNMATVMEISDILICKPGGLTCTEGVTAGTALLLVGDAIGQERVNVEFLEPRNIARHVADDYELVREFDKLMDSEAQLQSMIGSAEEFRTPLAAQNIARTIMGMILSD